jgi:hypothetical protein
MQHGEPDDDLLPLLLEIRENYFAGAGPAGRREVDALLRARDITGGPGWLIDMLAITGRRLQTPADPAGPATRHEP